MSAAMKIDQAAIASSVTAAIDGMVAEIANLMVADPERIARAVFSDHIIPPRDKTLPELRAACARRLETLKRLGRLGHWTYSVTEHLGVMAAKAALDHLLGAEGS